MTGATPPIRPLSKPGCATTASMRSRACWWFTTKPRPGSCMMSPHCAARSTPPPTRRCFSSLASMDFRMDEWGVDVVVAGSQKGLMLPTGMAFTGVSAKALAAAADAKLPRVYWDWRRLVEGSSQAVWNGTIPVHFFYGLQEALHMLEEEGLDNVFARHHRLAEATRRAVRVWRQNDGPETFAVDPRAQSDSVTAVLTPEGYDANKVREVCLSKFNVSLGGGLGPLQGRVFRIGHLGDLNEPMILGSLAAVEMALELTGVPHGKGGVAAAMDYLVHEA